MNQELFIYWRVAPGQLEPAAAGMQAWQAGLALQHAGLQARLLCRQDQPGSAATLMETYSKAGGLAPALQGQIKEQGDEVAAPWRDGKRHVEVFGPLPCSTVS